MQSLNDYTFVFFNLPTKILGLLLYRLKCIENTFPIVYYIPPKKIAFAKQKRKICNCLVTAYHDGQMNRNGKMIAVFFRNVFY